MKKDLLALAFVVLLVAVLARGVNIQSVEEYYLEHYDDITPESETVTLSIRCDTALANPGALGPALLEANVLPPDGAILPPTRLVLREGDTAFSILQRATKAGRIQMEHAGGAAGQSAYVRGIGHLYEAACGPLSGWMYTVNGQPPEHSGSSGQLQNGDELAWVYTCNLGRDIGAAAATGQAAA